MSTGSAGRGALDGLIVLDLTAMLAGPYCTMMLADQGARVIKIEPPGGDKTRRNGPHLEGALKLEQGGFGGYFGSTNRNKESLVIDLKSDKGRALFLRLVQRADVVIENYRSGVMERLGLSYERLSEINPRLVYGALRGFGDRRSGASQYLDWPAYDPVSQAMGGIMGITGHVRHGPPTKIGPGIGDIGPAMFLAFGITAACWSVQRTGKGQFVDVGMTDSILAICERIVFQYGVGKKSPGREGNGHPLLCPFGLFQALDGYISLGVPNDNFWAKMVECMGRPEWIMQDKFSTNDLRVANSGELEELLNAWTLVRTKRQLSEIFGGHIPFGPVFEAKDIFEDEHFQIRNMLVETEQPGANEKLVIAGTPVHMSDTPGGIRKRAPLVGEHTERVLRDLGLHESEIAELRKNNVVEQR
ncbi:CaiB/BaiF CoA-transferase family protein [Paraburkholderia sp.]|uniref:CaiB/BaiF CoA transferase family protein n=1 Tax=Paraburkholderia sp. TaxID=1926495 RepID=UPI0025D45480|nr:CoA transferase [Paraburkholderia sp.]